MADEPTAIRHAKRGKAHKPHLGLSHSYGRPITACWRWADDMTERVPLEQVVRGDRCKTCWPTSGEAGQ